MVIISNTLLADTQRHIRKPPSKPAKVVVVIRNDDGAHYGGKCDGCSGTLGFWYIYKICDMCITIRPSSVIKSVGAVIR